MTPYRDLIEQIATDYRLDPDLVEAVVIAESNGYTDAFRFESDFYRRYLESKPEYAGKNPRRISSSYGLLQIMFTTAQQYGFGGDPEMLFLPDLGLRFGCQHLASLLKHHGDVRTALAAYNAGNPQSLAGQTYASRVLKLYDSVKRAHPEVRA